MATEAELKQRLIDLYRQMADHTRPECARCLIPHSCCASEYCDQVIEYAKVKWGVELLPTGHPKLPLMGPKGCTAAPHLRPLCTVHTCAMNSIGSKPGDPKWTDEYFRLHDQIQQLEWTLFPL